MGSPTEIVSGVAAAAGKHVPGTRTKFPRFGITTTLTAAFLAVAVLAAAANLIVISGPSIVRTLQVQPRIDADAQASQLLQAPLIQSPATSHRDAEQLIAAVDQFSLAVKARAETDAIDTTVQMQRAADAMDRSAGAIAASVKGVAPVRHLKNLEAAIPAHKLNGYEIIQTADSRRALFDQYSRLLDQMQSRATAAVDRAWKILGRVVARQSLIKLSGSLENMVRQSATLTDPGNPDPTAFASILEAEAEFAATLQKDASGLARSQGKEWLSAMQEDFALLTAARNELHQLDEQLQKAGQRLVETSAQIGSIGTVLASLPVPVTPAMKPGSGLLLEQSNSEHLVGALSPALLPLRSVSTTVTPTDNSPRVLMAWISAGVLLLLVVVSFMTVRSIVIPVRRLLDATARLSKGDVAVRVPAGGIKELDTLGVAFNHMADQLATAQVSARSYQLRLEQQVIERTRELQTLAEHDPLTSLPNRRQLATLLHAAIEQAARSGKWVGVFILDVDNFKNINDGMGHTFGDGVLKALASRLQELVRDFGFAARLGGDEFTIVYAAANSIEDIRNAGWELVRAFQKTLSIDNRELAVSVSVGASLFPDHEKDAAALLRAADAALFRAKALGRSQLNVFTPELLQAAAEKFTTEQGLRRALERSEFELVFQPQMNLETQRVDLVEALIRWRQPDGRLAAPAEFLAVAEESGLIMDVSDWVLHTAIKAAAEWHHGAWPEARVAINVSSRQLIDTTFVERVMALLKEYRLPASCIEIELTETVLQTGAATVGALRRLRNHGVAIALDDFGTGYSSLASLQKLPFTRIKLDRSLIESIDTSSRAASIVRSIIGLCHGLGLEITAEGIERPAQLGILLGYGALYVQGYLFSKPVAQHDLPASIAGVPGRMEEMLRAARRSRGADRPDGNTSATDRLTILRSVARTR